MVLLLFVAAAAAVAVVLTFRHQFDMFAYISWDAFVLVLLLTLVALWDAVATYSHGVDLIPDRERLPGRIYRRVAVPLVFAGAAAFAHYLW